MALYCIFGAMYPPGDTTLFLTLPRPSAWLEGAHGAFNTACVALLCRWYHRNPQVNARATTVILQRLLLTCANVCLVFTLRRRHRRRNSPPPPAGAGGAALATAPSAPKAKHRPRSPLHVLASLAVRRATLPPADPTPVPAHAPAADASAGAVSAARPQLLDGSLRADGPPAAAAPAALRRPSSSPRPAPRGAAPAHGPRAARPGCARPVYVSGLRDATYLGKLACYHPTQIAAGWEARVAEALRNKGVRLLEACVRAGCIEVLVEAQQVPPPPTSTSASTSAAMGGGGGGGDDGSGSGSGGGDDGGWGSGDGGGGGGSGDGSIGGIGSGGSGACDCGNGNDGCGGGGNGAALLAASGHAAAADPRAVLSAIVGALGLGPGAEDSAQLLGVLAGGFPVVPLPTGPLQGGCGGGGGAIGGAFHQDDSLGGHKEEVKEEEEGEEEQEVHFLRSLRVSLWPRVVVLPPQMQPREDGHGGGGGGECGRSGRCGRLRLELAVSGLSAAAAAELRAAVEGYGAGSGGEERDGEAAGAPRGWQQRREGDMDQEGGGGSGGGSGGGGGTAIHTADPAAFAAPAAAGVAGGGPRMEVLARGGGRYLPALVSLSRRSAAAAAAGAAAIAGATSAVAATGRHTHRVELDVELELEVMAPGLMRVDVRLGGRMCCVLPVLLLPPGREAMAAELAELAAELAPSPPPRAVDPEPDPAELPPLSAGAQEWESTRVTQPAEQEPGEAAQRDPIGGLLNDLGTMLYGGLVTQRRGDAAIARILREDLLAYTGQNGLPATAAAVRAAAAAAAGVAVATAAASPGAVATAAASPGAAAATATEAAAAAVAGAVGAGSAAAAADATAAGAGAGAAYAAALDGAVVTAAADGAAAPAAGNDKGGDSGEGAVTESCGSGVCGGPVAECVTHTPPPATALWSDVITALRLSLGLGREGAEEAEAFRAAKTAWIVAQARTIQVVDVLSLLGVLRSRSGTDPWVPIALLWLLCCAVSLASAAAWPFLPPARWRRLAVAARFPRYALCLLAKGMLVGLRVAPNRNIAAFYCSCGLLIGEGLFEPVTCLLSPLESCALSALRLPINAAIISSCLAAAAAATGGGSESGGGNAGASSARLPVSLRGVLLAGRVEAVALAAALGCHVYLRLVCWRRRRRREGRSGRSERRQQQKCGKAE